MPRIRWLSYGGPGRSRQCVWDPGAQASRPASTRRVDQRLPGAFFCSGALSHKLNRKNVNERRIVSTLRTCGHSRRTAAKRALTKSCRAREDPGWATEATLRPCGDPAEAKSMAKLWKSALVLEADLFCATFPACLEQGGPRCVKIKGSCRLSRAGGPTWR
jgi:hypothetical protein